MSPKEQAVHLSNAILFVQGEIHNLEHNLYTTKHNRHQLVIKKRVLRALNHDLEKLVKTIPTPVQYSFFTLIEDDAPRVAPSELKETKPLQDDRGDLLPGGVQSL